MGVYEIVLFVYTIAGSTSAGYLVVSIALPQTRKMPEQYRYGSSIVAGGVMAGVSIAATIAAETILQKEDLFFAVLPIATIIAVLIAVAVRFALKPKMAVAKKTSIYAPPQKIGRIEIKQKIDETKKAEMENLIQKQNESHGRIAVEKQADGIKFYENSAEKKDAGKINLPIGETKEKKPFFPDIFIKKHKTETEKNAPAKEEIGKIRQKITDQKNTGVSDGKATFFSGLFGQGIKKSEEKKVPASDFEKKILEAGREAEMKAKKTGTVEEIQAEKIQPEEKPQEEIVQKTNSPEQENDIQRIREILKQKSDLMEKSPQEPVPKKEIIVPQKEKIIEPPVRKAETAKTAQQPKIDSEKKEAILKILRELKEKPSASDQVKNSETPAAEIKRMDKVKQIKNENAPRELPRRLQRFHRGEENPVAERQNPTEFDSEKEMTESLLYGTGDRGSRESRELRNSAEKSDYDSMAENIFTQIKKEPEENQPAAEIPEKSNPQQSGRDRFERRHRRDFSETENRQEQNIPTEPERKPVAAEEKNIPQAENEKDFEKEMQLDDELKGNESEKLEMDDLEKGLNFGDEKEGKSELCPNCSKETEQVIFCPNCGTAFCENCSKKTETGKHYCPSCGKIV